MDAVCFAGFTEEELRQYRELEERIGNRILHHLQAETAVSLALSVQHLEAPFIIFRRNPVCRK